MQHTLLDLLKLNSGALDVGIIDEAVGFFPEAAVVQADVIDGVEYETLHRIARGGAGWRGANEGTDPKADSVELRKVQTYIIERVIQADSAVAERYKFGVASYMAQQEGIALEAIFESIGYAFYYGQSAQSISYEDGNAVDLSKAFPGLVNAIDSEYEIDAGADSDKTSVFAVRSGLQAVRMVLGGNKALDLPDEYRKQHLLDENGKTYPAYTGELSFYPGLQTVSKHSQARIKNISATGATGKTLTAARMQDLEDKAPAGRPWSAYFMTKKARRQLWDDAVANLGGLSAWPAAPNTWNGVPIVVTDSISLDETV